MNMKKPAFWKNKNLFSVLLLPFSFFLQLLIIIRASLYSKKKFKIPTICVGNIYIGGTGKTPLSLFIFKELNKYKKNPAIIRKYYKEHEDEYKLAKNKYVSLFLDKKRSIAIKNAEQAGHNFAILDDGFQDPTISKDLSILCFNSKQLIGNGMTLPSGPLRESFKSVRNSQIVVINGEKNERFENELKKISSETKILYSNYIVENLDQFKDKSFIAFAGIGNPENFFDLLSENKINIKKKISFPDHYTYNRSDIDEMSNEATKENLELITTEKDYFRIKDMGYNNIKFVKLELKIEKKEQLINLILRCK